MAPSEIKLPLNRIKFLGVFTIEAVTNAIMDWFKSEGYEIFENYHKYKVTGGADYEIKWTGERNVTSYWKNKVVIEIKALGCREVEITKGKQVTQALHGRVYVWISPTVIGNWQDRFHGSLYEKLKEFFNKHIVDGQMGLYWDKLFYDCRALESSIRTSLNFETVMKSG